MSEWTNKVLIWGSHNRKGYWVFFAQSSWWIYQGQCTCTQQTSTKFTQYVQIGKKAPPPTPTPHSNESYKDSPKEQEGPVWVQSADLWKIYSFTISGKKFSLRFFYASKTFHSNILFNGFCMTSAIKKRFTERSYKMQSHKFGLPEGMQGYIWWWLIAFT